jgi:sec-independent protein translocase protein TatA
MKLGLQELLVIFAVVLLIFGPAKLPQIGAAIGKGIREFKKASRDISEQLDTDLDSTEDLS